MATEAQKRARQNFVNRFAYGLGRGVAHAKHEYKRKHILKPKTAFGQSTLGEGQLGLKRTRAAVAFLVGLGKGISKRKAEQMVENARRDQKPGLSGAEKAAYRAKFNAKRKGG